MPDNTLHTPEALQLHAGMPPLDESATRTSWFEFAPARLFYTPIALYCAWLSLKNFGITLPTNSNPALPYSGLVGESKFTVLNEMKGKDRALIAKYSRFLRWGGTGGKEKTCQEVAESFSGSNLEFPLVAKPDIGMRGTGVQLVHTQQQLNSYIENFPAGANFLLQELVDAEGEAGVFYVRHPDEEKGQIISLTLKYFPRVTGDGQTTLKNLILADPRAGKLAHLYLERHKDRLDSIIPKGESIRLAFAGNHCRGTIFRDGNDYITDGMIDVFDKLSKSMGEFYAGRFDVRFANFADFQKGKRFTIIEINGAGGEATHIWDSRMTLRHAYKVLMNQFSHLYTIGRKNRKRGFTPTPVKTLIKAWLHEKKLTKHYPITH